MKNILIKIDRVFRDFILFMIDLTKFLPITITNTAAKQHKPTIFNKVLLLIKLDEIGDYILFRNLLPYIKSSDKFKNYKIILCGNIAWKNIAENFDSEFVDDFVWMNKQKYLNNLLYRFKLLKKISFIKPKILINCSYSRSFFIDDSIAAVITANTKISFNTDLSNSYKWQIKISNKYYNTLYNNTDVFDFYKNRSFFEYILNIKIELLKPQITLNNKNKTDESYGNFVIIFLGGKRKYKKWKLTYFIEIANYIISKYNLNILLVGKKEEIKDNNSLFNHLVNKEKVFDLSEKTTLAELAYLLRKAKLLISNDSGIIHLAASVNTKTIVILNGSQYGRFIPYPIESGTEISAIYPPEIINNRKEFKKLYKQYRYRSLLDINSIRTETVKSEIDRLMPE